MHKIDDFGWGFVTFENIYLLQNIFKSISHFFLSANNKQLVSIHIQQIKIRIGHNCKKVLSITACPCQAGARIHIHT